MDNPHAEEVRAVLQALGTLSASGLTPEEASDRLRLNGPNEIDQGKQTSYLHLIVSQFQSPVVWLLAIAAIVAVAFGHFQEAVAILAVLILNGLIGFVTELKAIRSMDAIRQLSTTRTRVRRGGLATQIESRCLVPGDIALLAAGEVVAADMRITQANALQVNESALTGESTVVDKSSDPVETDTIIADQSSMLFKGTAITRGEVEAVVTGTGAQSELGRISALVAGASSEFSPMELQLKHLSGQLIWLTVALAALIAVIGILAGRDTFLMIESAIALAVAAIPEGLPIVATMTLARGMWRMAQQSALVERLAAVETLGATTVIFTDKTGTLTENKMTAAEIWTTGSHYTDLDHRDQSIANHVAKDPSLKRLLQVGVLCNKAELGGQGNEDRSTGDPVEIALLKIADDAHMPRSELQSRFTEIRHYPFDTERREMGTLHDADGTFLLAVKGAPEVVLQQADAFEEGGTEAKLSETRERWAGRAAEMASAGLRVLALAEKTTSQSDEDAFDRLTLLGLVGFRDPARADVADAVHQCREAGITVVMVTGDHPATAQHIAGDVGIDTKQRSVLEGQQLAKLSLRIQSERETLLDTRVFARVDPGQKLDLVTLHKEAGAVVAMTGDGVNDAPALRHADIGIAMGQRGTQVAREAADIVLLDDAFPTIVTAIRQGRIIFDNIRTFVVYLLSCNLSEVMVVGLAILFGLPLALLPLQILFLNLVTDIFPAFALAAGEGEEDVLKRRPRDPSEQIVELHHWFDIAKHGLTITIATLSALIIATRGLGIPDNEAVTISFLTLAFSQLFHVFNMREAGVSIITNQVTTNPWVWAALLLCTLLLLAAVYVPPMASVLRVVPPDISGWSVILSLSTVPVVLGSMSLKRKTETHR